MRKKEASVLIVDDDADHIFHLEKLLIDEGNLVHIATTAPEGLQILRDYRFDLVIVDLNLLKQSGFDLLAEIPLNSKTAHLPILALGDNVDAETVEHALEHGAIEYLKKPVEAPELLTLLRMAFKLKAQEQELEWLDQDLQDSQKKAEQVSVQNTQLLEHILPKEVAKEMSQDHVPKPQRLELVSLLAISFSGFPQFVSQTDPELLLPFITQCHETFGPIAAKYQLHKLHSFGRTMYYAGGITHPTLSNPVQAALTACEIQASYQSLKPIGSLNYPPLKISIYSGKAVVGVLNSEHISYQVYPEEEYQPQQMLKHCSEGKVLVSATSLQHLTDYYQCLPVADTGYWLLHQLDAEFRAGNDPLKPTSEFESYWV